MPAIDPGIAPNRVDCTLLPQICHCKGCVNTRNKGIVLVVVGAVTLGAHHMKGCSFMKCFALVMLMAISSAASALDCQHPNSTPENNQCAALDAAAADTKLNETYQRVLALFEGPNDEAGRWYPASTKASLIAAEREWIKYRDDNCTAIFNNYKAGTIHTVMELECRKELTDQRIKALELFSGPG